MEKGKKLNIIRAAAKRFDRHGISKTTLDEIARDLRIGKATIYHYFTSKDELYYEVLEWEGSVLIEELEAILTNREISPKEKLILYLSLKDSVQQKFKLIYDALINILSDKGFDREKIFISKLFSEEEKALSKLLFGEVKPANTDNDNAAGMLVHQSWSFLLAGKISFSRDGIKLSFSKEFFISIMEEKFLKQAAS